MLCSARLASCLASERIACVAWKFFFFLCLQHLCPNFTLCIVSFNLKLLLNLTYLHCRICRTLLHYKWTDPFVRWDALLSGAYMWVRRIFGCVPPEVCCALYLEHLHPSWRMVACRGMEICLWRFLGYFFIFFYLTFKPDCLIKLSKTCSKTLQMCPQTCLSREVLWSCKAQLCVFVRSFFFFFAHLTAHLKLYVCVSVWLVTCTALEKWIWEERLESFWIGLAACGHFKRTLLKAHF